MSSLLNRLGRTAALIVATGMVAHAASDGNLAVTVLDVTGKPVSGATITITSATQIGGAKTATTDASGKVRFPRLAPGAFKVVIVANNYQTQTLNNIEVQVDQTAAVNAKLIPVGGATVEVVSSVPLVDVSTVTQGAHIDSEQIENLPIGRTQAAAIALAPGVVSVGGDPVLAAGLGRDNNGNNGARNNTYLIDGIDVTSPETGTSRTNIPVELIQDQDIKTGAITAEYSARAGLFSNAITKVGGNEYSGGFTTLQQSPSLVNSVGPGKPSQADRKINDYTVYAMGPIIKDKLWFVVSGQKVKDTQEVALASTAAAFPGESRTALNNDEQRYFMKLTWQIAPAHMASATFNRNPSSFNNGQGFNTPTRQLAKTERGGSRYTLNYTWQASPSLYLDAKINRHEESDTAKAAFSDAGPQNIIRSSTTLTGNQALQGNSSASTERKYRRDQFRADATWLFDGMGSHTFKAGFQVGQDQLTQLVGVAQGVAYESFDQPYTYAQIRATPGVGGAVRGAFSKLRAAINGQAQYAAVLNFLDTNHDGTVSTGELDAYSFNILLDPANPSRGYAGYRLNQVDSAKSTPKMKSNGFYVQDQWQMGRFTFTPGFRVDSYEFLADNGTSLFKASGNVAPRLGMSMDVNGDGKSKFFVYMGRYIDPIKLDMVRFTGSLTSSVRTEDIAINHVWVTENVRGGTKVVDAVFADNFKLPKTDELRVGFSRDFGLYSAEITGTYRRDFDIVEDWDPTLYTDPDALEGEARSLFNIGTGAGQLSPTSTLGAKIIGAFRALGLSPDFFKGGGFTGQQNVDRVNAGQLNFVLANLPGGHRTFRTLDLTINRKFQDNWGGFVSASLVNATGNSLSSGNADFQGDLAQFDPRLPYTNGKLEGSVDWLAKAYAYYKWDMGLLVGMTGNWNSGYHYSDSFAASGRALQLQPPAALFGSEQLGKNRTPSIAQYDMRVQYGFGLGKFVKGEVYVDVINVFNKQEPTGIAEGVNVRAGFQPGEAFAYQAPRRYLLGARLKF